MTKEDVTVRQTVRFPKSIHESVEAARGEPGKPRASFNDTLLYLVREGLKATRGETSKEHSMSAVAGLHAGEIWTSDDFDDPLPEKLFLGDE